MASTLHLALAATVAFHLVAAVVVDAIGVVSKDQPKPKPTTLSLVDIDTSQLPKPPPPTPTPEPTPPAPVIAPTAPTVPPPPTDRRRPNPQRTSQTANTDTPPATTAPPVTTTAPTPGGGAPTFKLPDGGADGRGPEVARGRREIGPTGSGGSGGGAGGGSGGGAGSGEGPPRPMSIAAIKTKAKPRGNFDYWDAGKNYPPEARQLGVEGVIKAKLIVDERGKVGKVTLLKPTLGHGLDELALARARVLEFDPALDADDRPVASIVVWEFTFTLPR